MSLINNIFKISTDDNSIKKFNRLFAIIFLLLDFLAIYKNNLLLIKIFTLSFLFFIIFSFIIPKITIFLYYPWMVLANILSLIMQKVILIIIFYLFITPLALIFKIAGKEFMTTHYDKSKNTYWIKKDTKSNSPELFKKQFS